MRTLLPDGRSASLSERHKVSVLTTTFQRPGKLREALASLALQTVPADEVIVVNNDWDSSRDVDEVVAGTVPDAVVIHNQKNLGQAGSKNVGISAATGDVIALLDDDDVWEPGFLDAHLAAHAKGGAAVVYCGYTTFWDDVPLAPRIHQGETPPADTFSEMIAGRFTIGTNSVLSIDAEILREVGGYDETLIGFLDWDLLVRIAQRGAFRSIPESLVRFRMHLGGRQSDPATRSQELAHIREKWAGIPGIEEMVERFTADALYNGARYESFRGSRGEATRLFIEYLKAGGIRLQGMGSTARLLALVTLGPGAYATIQRSLPV